MFHGTTIAGRKIETNVKWPINRRIGELNLTDACNLRCPNCQASCNIVPSEDFLPVEKVEEFVNASIRLKHSWDKIKCTGGEAAIHPYLHKIVNILGEYRKWHSKCDIAVLTNGTEYSSNRVQGLPDWCRIQSQDTLDNKSWEIFESAHVAPIDLPDYQNIDEAVFRQGCCRITICGGCTVGTNGLYYPCNILYHINRVFDLGLGLKSLDDYLSASDEELRDMLKPGCRLCGYFKYPRDTVGKQVTSPTWEKAFSKYKSSHEEYPFSKYKASSGPYYQIKLP
jgi:MoaA/NifB/PqqE/SkfB family radical SAM enzyme